MGDLRMKRSIKLALMSLATGAVALHAGGCSVGGGGIDWFWRMLGDAVGDTFAYNIFLD
jgi:hypothetical protein